MAYDQQAKHPLPKSPKLIRRSVSSNQPVNVRPPDSGRAEKGLAKPSALPGFGSGRKRFFNEAHSLDLFPDSSVTGRVGVQESRSAEVVASSDQAFRYTDLERVRAAASALAAISVGPAFRQFPLRADSSVVKKHSCGVVELPRYSPSGYGQNLVDRALCAAEVWLRAGRMSGAAGDTRNGVRRSGLAIAAYRA